MKERNRIRQHLFVKNEIHYLSHSVLQLQASLFESKPLSRQNNYNL